jgi:hypothetical protein
MIATAYYTRITPYYPLPCWIANSEPSSRLLLDIIPVKSNYLPSSLPSVVPVFRQLHTALSFSPLSLSLSPCWFPLYPLPNHSDYHISTMSSSIAIPKRKQARASGSGYTAASSSSSSSSSSSPYPSWANRAASPFYSASSLASTSASPSSASTSSSMARYVERRPSLLGM